MPKKIIAIYVIIIPSKCGGNQLILITISKQKDYRNYKLLQFFQSASTP